MSTKRLWAISGAAAALVVTLVLIVLALAPKASEATPESTPSATSSPSAKPSPTASVTPTPTFTAPTAVEATCENTSTDLFRSMMDANGWVSWTTGSAFDGFPNSTPDGAITCTWGGDPDVATDNIITLAWSPIDPESAVAAMAKLEEEGFIRINAPEGIYLSVPGEAGWADEEGWGATYFFGFDDVRWAATKADVTAYVKAPTEVG